MINETSAAEARDDLFKFVEELYGFLQRTTQEPYDHDGKLLILPEMRDELRGAWAHFADDFSWDRAKLAIYYAPDARLESHGLYGLQLRAKLRLFRLRLRRFTDRLTKKGLWKLINAADTVLDSIIAATGLDEALREIKDLLGNCVDDDDG